MKRNIEKNLLYWKNKKNHLPLLIRGARQVGKTYIVNQFAKEHFENCININFEQNPEYKECFKTLQPKKILSSIELISNQNISFGNTLLFLDEIQECPQAIQSLRYFKEELPLLHLIGAGSLLEFVLNEPDFKMPVGRIEFMYMRPVSFGEFLDATNNSKLRSFLNNIQLKEEIDNVIHEKLLSLVKEYFALGGMPAVIEEFLESSSLINCQDIQSSILLTYRRDFGKYSTKLQHEHLQTIFTKAPGLVGKWLKYSSLDPNTSAITLKNALKKLTQAGLITIVYTTSGSGLPFISHINEKKIKILFLDIGLVKRACNLDLELLFKEDIFLINDGALAEQYVGQELLATYGKDELNELFSWVREEKSSTAEIDFLISVDSHIVPIEVKARAIGSLRSLKIFMEEKKIPFGVRVSQAPFFLQNNVLSIPFYMVEEISRLIKDIYKL
jgi:uncharacterized protein